MLLRGKCHIWQQYWLKLKKFSEKVRRVFQLHKFPHLIHSIDSISSCSSINEGLARGWKRGKWQEFFIQALLLGKCMCNHRKTQFILFIYELEFWKWSGYNPHIAHLFTHQHNTITYFTDSNSSLRKTTSCTLLTNWREKQSPEYHTLLSMSVLGWESQQLCNVSVTGRIFSGFLRKKHSENMYNILTAALCCSCQPRKKLPASRVISVLSACLWSRLLPLPYCRSCRFRHCFQVYV